jgi:hypothetical protein
MEYRTLSKFFYWEQANASLARIFSSIPENQSYKYVLRQSFLPVTFQASCLPYSQECFPQLLKSIIFSGKALNIHFAVAMYINGFFSLNGSANSYNITIEGSSDK